MVRKAKASKRPDEKIVIERVEEQTLEKAELDQHINRLRFQIMQWQRQISQMESWIKEAESELNELETVLAKF